MSKRRYHIVLNPNSGTALAAGITPENLEQRLEALGHDVTIDADADRPFAERAARAVASPADVIVAAGGDGTVTGLANALVGTDKSLAILPLGTVNLLARDLHMPLDLDQAVSAIGSLEPRHIDVGEVNGRIFLHKVVIGLIPGIAAAREHIRGRENLAAKLGFFRYFLRRLARARRIAIAIEPLEGESRVERVQSIAVASNAYEEGFGQIFARQRLDRGSLTLYILKHLTFVDVMRLSTEMVLGRWREDEALSIESVRGVTIRSRKRQLKVMLDGEVESLETPLVFRIRPKALSVLAPAAVDEISPQAEQQHLATGV